MIFNLQQIKYRKIKQGKKPITQKNIKKIIIKRIRLKIKKIKDIPKFSIGGLN